MVYHDAPPFWLNLEVFGDATALVDDAGQRMSYRNLAREADEARSALPAAGLIAIEAANQITAIVTYLACLRAGRPVLLLPPEKAPGQNAAIIETYRPVWLVQADRPREEWARTAGSTIVEPHPDLRVLLTTSGSTGSPKLVRLSARNINSNAKAIAEYLDLTSADRAPTTLSFSYSYGMAVLNSHLSVGATLLLTEKSVTDKAFWSLFAREKATSLACVPYHFDLLDRVGFAEMALPSLRYVTQAGGRLSDERIKNYARLGQSRGWLFYVMYGQTEASPRMSYLPPHDAIAHSDTIGRAIPGGTLWLRGTDGRPIETLGSQGELMYAGPNVMMGYAETSEDLRHGNQVEALETGDIATKTENGYYKIVGRAKRFTKLYGLRINLDDVESSLSTQLGSTVYCAGSDTRLAVFATSPVAPARIHQILRETIKIQPSDVDIIEVPQVPRLLNDKPDYKALNEVHRAYIAEAGTRARENPPDADTIADHVRIVLGNQALPDSISFAETGSDSLSYLNVSLVIEEKLGYLPDDWEKIPLGSFSELEPRSSRSTMVETDLLVRFFALVGVVLLHSTGYPVAGGAFVLLALTGYSLARFQTQSLMDGRYHQIIFQSLTKILVLYYIIIASYSFSREIPMNWFFLMGNMSGGQRSLIEPYWFISAYAQLIVIFTLVFAVFMKINPPWRPSSAGMTLLSVGFIFWIIGYFWINEFDVTMRNPLVLFHLLPLGWIIYYAQSNKEKMIATLAVLLVSVFLWSYSLNYQLSMLFALSAIIWLKGIRLPTKIARALKIVGASSIYIYLAHVVPVHIFRYSLNMEAHAGKIPVFLLSLLASIAIGVLIHLTLNRLVRLRSHLNRQPA
ncbi:AMP-binding protein [Bosea beijingensis]|uniref:AMP-binding protein n=1 Tax=Bosea beijingensis TaxID=3068632 RepID=UPI0027421F6C|nr:AMP-binding protein [Bosea sp. REN20]